MKFRSFLVAGLLLSAIIYLGAKLYGQTAVSAEPVLSTSASSAQAAAPQPQLQTIPLPPDLSIPPSTHHEKSAFPKLDTAMARIQVAIEGEGQDVWETAVWETVVSEAISISNQRIQAQIVIQPQSLQRVHEAVTLAGGEVTGIRRDASLLQAWLPPAALSILTAEPAVQAIRRPPKVVLADFAPTDVTTEGFPLINGIAWHAAGYTGTGVKIGIIDNGFEGYSGLLGNDLPTSVTVKNFVDGETDGEVDGTTKHGTACAEIIHDIAPGAELFLVKIATDIDLQEAVNYLIGQQVDIISTSLGFYNVSPGDGSGFLAQLADLARSNGILWVTAAGNDREVHWGGAFYDPDGDGFHNFDGEHEINFFGPASSQAYLLPAGFPIHFYMRWDDWINVNQDYDVYLFRYIDSFPEQVGGSFNFQTGQAGQLPTEGVTAVASGPDAAYGIAVQRRNSNRSVNFEMFAPKMQGINFRLSSRSLANLADAPHVLTVAAQDVNAPFSQESYSSEGPTNGPGGMPNGGVIKPDMAAFANVSTSSYGAEAFSGTSAATPHVAGAAALILGSNPEFTPNVIQNMLQDRAIDMGAVGNDVVFGNGRVHLGDPPLPPPTGSAFNLLPIILKQLPPTPTPTPSPTPDPNASMEVTNSTGGNLQIELAGYATHIFPEGVSLWEAIPPGSYQAIITSLDGPCSGSSITEDMTLPAGEISRFHFTCGANMTSSAGLTAEKLASQ